MDDGEQRRGSDGYVGIRQHGDPTRGGTKASKRAISSAVWGGVAIGVSSEHGEPASWDPCQQDGVCNGTPCPGGCCWYEYAEQVCMSGCVHPGMDIATPHGTPLFAAANGTVEHCGPDQFYQPIHVDIRDDQGRLHIMGHMSSASGDLAVGGRVSAGQRVGLSGTPPGAGAHVHYELRDARGCAIDPEPALVNGADVQMAVFEPRDVIRVADGPVRLRKGTGTDSAIVAELVTGTKLCVLAGPEEATGFTWYRVRLQLDNSGGEGWVAGRYCELVEKGACD